MNTIRQPAVAGAFYPFSSDECRHQLDEFLSHPANYRMVDAPKAMIVPHAGWMYSGEAAAKAYGLLKDNPINRVVLLGPSHRVPLRGMALSSAVSFRTPLGDIHVDHHEDDALLQIASVQQMDEAHELEHCLEVQLPFLQSVLEDFTIIPIVVGLTSAVKVANLINYFWGKPGTLILVSTDLSHYLPYDEAVAVDAETTRQILGFSTDIKGEQACGCYALNGLLLSARQHDAQIDCVALTNSGETAGDKTRVVGYGSYVLY